MREDHEQDNRIHKIRKAPHGSGAFLYCYLFNFKKNE